MLMWFKSFKHWIWYQEVVGLNPGLGNNPPHPPQFNRNNGSRTFLGSVWLYACNYEKMGKRNCSSTPIEGSAVEQEPTNKQKTT